MSTLCSFVLQSQLAVFMPGVCWLQPHMHMLRTLTVSTVVVNTFDIFFKMVLVLGKVLDMFMWVLFVFFCCSPPSRHAAIVGLCQRLIVNSNCVCLLIKQSQQKKVSICLLCQAERKFILIFYRDKKKTLISDFQRCKFIISWLDEWNVLHLTPLIKSYSDTEVDGWGVPNVKINGEPWK